MRIDGDVVALLLVAVLVWSSAPHAQTPVTLSRVTMEPHRDKRFDFMLVVADVNGDGRADVLAGGREEYAFEGNPRGPLQ